MLTPDQLLGFLLAAVLVTISPGPDNLMVLGTGMSRGRASGIAFGVLFKRLGLKVGRRMTQVLANTIFNISFDMQERFVQLLV